VADRPQAPDEGRGPADVVADHWPAAHCGAGEAVRQPEDRCMKKILLVEDNELNRDMLSRRLRKRGYDVVTAVDGEDGIAKARSEAPALILMDVSLPGIDGWEATRYLKSAPETRQIPIVALTAHVLPADHDKALAVGCDDFDTKPIDLPRLLGKIETLLTQGHRA
jgi:two-component system, cell cycle response regulator DivK